MKKIGFFILLIVSFNLMNAQKTREVSKLEKLNLKPIESFFDEQTGKKDMETQALRVSLNEHFKSEAKEATEIAWSYLYAKQDDYKLSNELEDMKIVKTIDSPAGKYVYYQQYVNDIPVFATNFTVYVNKENVVAYALNEFRNIAKYRDITNKSSIADYDALRIAKEYLNVKEDIIGEPKTELVYFESIDKGLELAWKINIISKKPMGDWQIFVSASDQHIIHSEDIAMHVDVYAKIFNPNPITTAQTVYGSTNDYKDNNDATNASLNAQLKTVVLSNIKFENGVYKLEGPCCKVVDIDSPFGHNLNPVITTSGGVTGFHYTRNQTEFEAIMCYYHIDAAGKRVAQLGYFDSGLNELRVDPHGFDGIDYSAYISSNYIIFGDGGVDDAEDANVIWHEYGHAMQNNIGAGKMSTAYDTKCLKEGSSDYWAISYKRSLSSYNWWLFADWDGHNQFITGRRADLNWIYPTDYNPDITADFHINGQIWSSALMKIWGDLGRDVTDKLFLETHLLWGQQPTFIDAASAFAQADMNLYNGNHLCQIYARFIEHGLVSNFISTNFFNQTVTTNKTVTFCGTINVQNVKVQNGAKLTLDAAGEVFLNSDVEIALGSELEIK